MKFERTQIISIVIGAIIISGVSFFAGSKMSASAAPTRGGFAQGAGGPGAGAGRNINRGAATIGTVVAKDATSITVQLMAPNASTSPSTGTGSRIVLYSGSTQVGKFTLGSATDIAVGANVMVTGTPNTDGSITAQMIQLRPAGMPGFGGPRGGGAPSSGQ